MSHDHARRSTGCAQCAERAGVGHAWIRQIDDDDIGSAGVGAGGVGPVGGRTDDTEIGLRGEQQPQASQLTACSLRRNSRIDA
jgi:hypothetical protein